MALFKIFNNIDSHGELPSTYNKGYMYFDAVKGLFYIDTAGTGTTTGTRMALNAWGAQKSYADENGDRISTTYVKAADLGDLMTGTAKKVAHTLTFGNGEYVFDGSADVTIPVYSGEYTYSGT